MASRKEYEMLFALNARMNGGFSSTFSKAQAEFSRLGKEIQKLSKTQGDISAYQKQQAAAEKTTAKLESLKRQEQLLQQELTAAKTVQASTDAAAKSAADTLGAESDAAKELALEAQKAAQSAASLEREHQKLQDRISSTEGTLERQNQRLTQTGEALKSAGVNMGNLGQESQRLAHQMEGLRAQQEEVANSAQTFGDKMSGAFEAAGDAFAAAGFATAFGVLKDGIMEASSVAAGFEASMSNVAALSQANASEMAQLNATAKEYGASTQYTAKQASEAMGYMSMAGWNAGQMMAGLGDTLSLSAASGEDLATTADIVTDALTAFGLTASDAGHFADVMAVAATKANTNVGMMGETFKYVAPVAGSLHYSIDDTALAIGLMANSSIKASQAGTALRSIVTRLSTDAGATEKSLGALGVLTEKLGVEFYNFDGSARDLNSVLMESREAWQGLTDAEQISYAKIIAGQEAMSGWVAIMNSTDADVNKLAASIENANGAAAEMAAIKLDNLNGDIALAESAWEGLQIAVGEKVNPTMRLFYQEQAKVLGWMGEFVDRSPVLVQTVTAAGGAFLGLATAITTVSAATKALKALDMMSMFAGPAGMVLKVGTGLAAVVAAVIGINAAYHEQVPTVNELTEATRGLNDAIEAGADSMADQMAGVAAAANTADLYISKLEQMGDVGKLDASGAEEYHNVLTLLTQTVPDLADKIDLENNAIEGGTAALREQVEAWRENAKAQAYQGYYTEVYKQQAAAMVEAEKRKVELTSAEMKLEAAEKKHSDATARMNQLYGEAQAKASAYRAETGDVADVTSYLTDEYYELQDSLVAYSDEIQLAKDNVKVHQQAIEENAAALEESQTVIEETEQAVKNLMGALDDDAGTEAISTAGEMDNVLQSVKKSVSDLEESYGKAYAAAQESIGGQYALWEEADEIQAISMSSLNNALNSQISYWEQYDQNLENLIARSSEIEGLQEAVAHLADGSPESVNLVAGLANATDAEVQQAVKKINDLKGKQDDAAQSQAKFQEDYEGKLDEIVQYTEESVEQLNLDAEARAAAEKTLNAYVEAASAKEKDVRNIYARIAAAARSTMNSLPMPSANGYTFTAALRGFAFGTESAPPGWAWVGEQGPELMNLRGGETILPADVSAKIADASSYAGGTPNTAASLALASERGPELLRAPEVIAAQIAVSDRWNNAMQPSFAEPAQTLYAIDNSSGNKESVILNLTYSPTYEISGVSNSAEMESFLRRLTAEQREELAEFVLDTMEDHERIKAMERFRE